LYISQ